MSENATLTTIVVAVIAGVLTLAATMQSCIHADHEARLKCYEQNKARSGSEVALLCGALSGVVGGTK